MEDEDPVAGAEKTELLILNTFIALGHGKDLF
jgi:hypothetical protein